MVFCTRMPWFDKPWKTIQVKLTFDLSNASSPLGLLHRSGERLFRHFTWTDSYSWTTRLQPERHIFSAFLQKKRGRGSDARRLRKFARVKYTRVYYHILYHYYVVSHIIYHIILYYVLCSLFSCITESDDYYKLEYETLRKLENPYTYLEPILRRLGWR